MELNTITEDFKTDLTCIICTELFVKAATLNCSHTFCKSCIEEWKKKNKRCPICRVLIKTMTPATVLDNFVNAVIESSSDEIKNNRKVLIEERESPSVKTSKKVVKFKPDSEVVRRTVICGTSGGNGLRNLTPSTIRSMLITLIDNLDNVDNVNMLIKDQLDSELNNDSVDPDDIDLLD